MGTDKIACSPIKIVLFCVYLLDYGSSLFVSFVVCSFATFSSPKNIISQNEEKAQTFPDFFDKSDSLTYSQAVFHYSKIYTLAVRLPKFKHSCLVLKNRSTLLPRIAPPDIAGNRTAVNP